MAVLLTAWTAHVDGAPSDAADAWKRGASPFLPLDGDTPGLQLDAGDGHRAWLSIGADPHRTSIVLQGWRWSLHDRRHAEVRFECAAARPFRSPPTNADPPLASLWIPMRERDLPVPTLTGCPLAALLALLIHGGPGTAIAAQATVGACGSFSPAQGRLEVLVPHMDFSVPEPDIEVPMGELALPLLEAIASGEEACVNLWVKGSDTRMAFRFAAHPKQGAAAAAMLGHCRAGGGGGAPMGMAKAGTRQALIDSASRQGGAWVGLTEGDRAATVRGRR